MNSRKTAKNKRRLVKSNSRVDRMGQHNRALERKPNIASKRVTLLPGFLINGFTSDTAKKGGGRRYQKSKELLLSENLQSIFEQKGNLRRSQRLSKRFNDGAVMPYENFSNNIEPSTSNNSSPNVRSQTVSYKPILKKNPKSIFKEISDKMCKVQTGQQSAEEDQRPYQTYRTPTRNNRCPANKNEETYNVETFLENTKSNFQASRCSHLALNCNANFCTSFSNKIRVSFKKNVVNEYKEMIKNEINNVNLVLSGKSRTDEKTLSSNDDTDLENKCIENTLPVPPGNWVYHTPKNQRINASQPLECQIKPGVIHANNKRFDLYEVKPQYKVNNNQEFDWNMAQSPPGRPHFKSEVTMPPHFGFNRNEVQEMGFENRQQNYNTGMEAYKQQCDCIGPRCIPFYQSSNTPMITNDFDNYFKIQQSQPLQINKRGMGDENDFMRTPNFISNSNGSTKNLFNFNNARGNMFDFG